MLTQASRNEVLFDAIDNEIRVTNSITSRGINFLFNDMDRDLGKGEAIFFNLNGMVFIGLPAETMPSGYLYLDFDDYGRKENVANKTVFGSSRKMP